MGISVCDNRFVLHSPNMTYAFRVVDGELRHDHWGAFTPDAAPADDEAVPGWQHPRAVRPREFPEAGGADTRPAAIRVLAPRQGASCDLRYMSHTVTAGKPALPGLPQVWVDTPEAAQTLQVHLEDSVTKLQATLSYTLLAGHDVICRRVTLHNAGPEALWIEHLASFSVDMPCGGWDLLQLSGHWAGERTPVRRKLAPGELRVASRQGFSGHEHNPFVAVVAPGADETHGEVFATALLYSGAFSAQAEQSPQGWVRLTMGLNDELFRWQLAPGETFHSPECIAVYSHAGLGAMSRTLHNVLRQHVCRGAWTHRLRPILVNNWEATYFYFTSADIEAIAQAGQALGLQMMVLDDGWFGERYPRNSDDVALGDWVPNRDKLPEGLAGLGKRLGAMGLRFGLWVEPEMVSRQSALYEAHPDWCLAVPDRARTEQRQQLLLDLSRPDVVDHVIATMGELLSTSAIDYIKWDCNRGMHEIGSAAHPDRHPGEIAHRYMLGLYQIFETLTQQFPQVLFESCASGGGRFDGGMLHYTPQIWTSDNTDALDRLTIQWGTSYAYPASSMGAHVSAVPNHQVWRTTPLRFRAHVAMMAGSFGYEMDLRRMPEQEREQTQEHIRVYRQIAPVVHYGDLFRLRSPQDSNWPALAYVSKDRQACVVFAFCLRGRVNGVGGSAPRLVLQGLDPDATYADKSSGDRWRGNTLMGQGLGLNLSEEYDSTIIQLQVVV